MPAKGVSTRLNPVRLQTIPHLRVRRPNQHEQNPCVTVMSSMLSMLDYPLACCEWGIGKLVDGALTATNQQAAGLRVDTAWRGVRLLSSN